MKPIKGKYHPIEPVKISERVWPTRSFIKAPIWCSVDLRDGNQALPKPMNIETKLAMFQLLTRIGFKEIEVGFPSASDSEFNFVRLLIEENLIPEDVTIQVIAPAREALIRRTFESLKGVKRAIFHLYHSLSDEQRRAVYRMSRSELLNLAVDSTGLVKECAENFSKNQIRFQYTPENFNCSDLDFALEVCEIAMATWQPSPKSKMILNLPSSVEISASNQFADRVEWMHRNISRRDSCILSIHTHNDHGSGVASAELSLLAGAERVEGTLFGNGERAGNCDITILALNLFSIGIDPKLDFSDLPHIARVYQECIGMPIHPRHPYAGDLVFCAFSGSHQDAIAKGLKVRQETQRIRWDVPYLPIDPQDIGRSHASLIRFTSQSGKGGADYILEENFGITLPKGMLAEFQILLKKEAEKGELAPSIIWNAFRSEYLDRTEPLHLLKVDCVRDLKNKVEVHVEIEVNKEKKALIGIGVGPLDAFAHLLRTLLGRSLHVLHYEEQSIGKGSDVAAIAFVEIAVEEGKTFYGAGMHEDLIFAALSAFLSAYNRSSMQAVKS